MEDKNEEVVVDTKTDEGEGDAGADTVSVSKADYDKLNQTLGSLKRELKDLKKPKEDLKDTPDKTKADDNQLLAKLERMSLRQAGVTEAEDIELAQKTAKKWGVDIDEVLADEDFKVKLERQQTARANTVATSKVKGGAGGGSQAKNDPAYWQAKGVPPTPADVPDRATRAKIVRSMIAKEKGTGGNPFYNGN